LKYLLKTAIGVLAVVGVLATGIEIGLAQRADPKPSTTDCSQVYEWIKQTMGRSSFISRTSGGGQVEARAALAVLS
jgi:hypothetical protein